MKQAQTIFIAVNVLRNEDGKHVIIGSGPNGQQYFLFEVSREVANELAKNMDLEIVNVKHRKSWQEDQENAEAVNAVGLQ